MKHCDMFRVDLLRNKLVEGDYKIIHRNGRSKIWQLYGEILRDDGQLVPETVFCRVCEAILKFNGKQTSNLTRHKCYVINCEELSMITSEESAKQILSKLKKQLGERKSKLKDSKNGSDAINEANDVASFAENIQLLSNRTLGDFDKSARISMETVVTDMKAGSQALQTNKNRIKAIYQSLPNKPDSPPTQQFVQMLKENSILNEQPYGDDNKRTKPNSLMHALDDTDIFFLSMSRMTKKLPTVEQSRIKLKLSSAVLSAEIKCHAPSRSSTLQSQQFAQRETIPPLTYISTSPPAPTSTQTMLTHSENSEGDEDFKYDPIWVE